MKPSDFALRPYLEGYTTYVESVSRLAFTGMSVTSGQALCSRAAVVDIRIRVCVQTVKLKHAAFRGRDFFAFASAFP